MDKHTVFFRADGGAFIGMGHFVRTLALAEMLNEHFHCVYATQNPSEYQIHEIGKVCHGRIDLPEDESHFDLFLSLLNGDEIVVLDNYYFTTDYQKAIKAKGCKLVCIDDTHDKHYVADIIINHAEGIPSSAFSKEPDTKLLLGYKYALIRKEFRDMINLNEGKKYACMIMMGGADPFDITTSIIKAIQNLEIDKPIAVVNGVNQNKNSSHSDDKFIYFNRLNAKEVAQLMADSDFGIFPASSAAIEATAIRLPFICGYFIKNQHEVYKGIKRNEMAICIDNFLDLKTNQIIEAINLLSQAEVQKKIRKKQIALLDKNAKKRYLKLFLDL